MNLAGIHWSLKFIIWYSCIRCYLGKYTHTCYRDGPILVHIGHKDRYLSVLVVLRTTCGSRPNMYHPESQKPRCYSERSRYR